LIACEEDPTPPTDPFEKHQDLTKDQGFTVKTPAYEVAEGEEVQDCYFVAVPDINEGAPVWIDRFVLAVREGSHHVNVFRVKTIVALDGAPGDVVKSGECFKSPNWADWPLVVNSQQSSPGKNSTDWKLPAGVAQKFLPGEKLMLQVHYVNAETQNTPAKAEVFVDFHKSAKTDPIEMGTLFATQQSIRICQSNPKPTYHGTCAFPAGADVHIAAANGHFHSRGEQFDIYAWDGTTEEVPPTSARFYESASWDDPPMKLGLDQVVKAGGGVWWTCDYQWTEPDAPASCDSLNEADKKRFPNATPDCCYTFGPKVEANEHCNVFVYYWPKVDTNINCN
jgi:hypothetical protein